MNISKIIFAIAIASTFLVSSCRDTKTESTDDHGHEQRRVQHSAGQRSVWPHCRGLDVLHGQQEALSCRRHGCRKLVPGAAHADALGA